MKLIACITFGHEQGDIRDALRSAVELALTRSDLTVVAIDDCSGTANYSIPGVEFHRTPARVGFPGVVNYLVSELYPDADRLVLVNPDAAIDVKSLSHLVDSKNAVEVPQILNSDGFVENVRAVTNAGDQFRNLLFGERHSELPVRGSADLRTYDCPPFAASGAIVGLDAQQLRVVPLRAEFFWLEMSDWVLRSSLNGLRISLTVNADRAQHSGASTSVSYPVSVAASQMFAKATFIRTYGGALTSAFLPIAMAAKSIRFGIMRRSLRDALFVYQCGLGNANWRVSR